MLRPYSVKNQIECTVNLNATVNARQRELGSLGGQVFDQLVHEFGAGFDLGELDIFVWAMRHRDTARPANHRGDTAFLEESRLGAIGNRIGLIAAR